MGQTGRVPSPSLLKSLETTCLRYQESLHGPGGEYLLEYLTNRGLSERAIQLFRLGWVENPIPGHEEYLGRISIPYLTRAGVVDIRFRANPNDPSRQKYKTIPGHESRMYNTSALMYPAPEILICEGEIDTIIASMCGYAAVGIPGAGAWKTFYAPLFAYRDVVVVVDNDDTGAGRETFAKKIVKDIPAARLAICPEGHDLNSWYMEAGQEGVQTMIGGD